MFALPTVLIAAAAIVSPGMAGNWELRASDTAIFQLEVVETSAGATATWTRPTHFQTDGESFSHISGPVIRRHTRSVRSLDGDVELAFDDPTANSTPDKFRMHRVDVDHVDVTYEGTPFEPFTFVRAASQLQVGEWKTGRSYVRSINRPSNSEMSAIFNADQADRTVANIDWTIVGAADDKRRSRTQKLLDSGALQSGEDFYYAAFIFQHGNAPSDYLKAHLLAMIAIARGNPSAIWIASATLDRYLQNSGKAQVLGTQYLYSDSARATQEPYDRTLISDTMRKALHVPSLAEQEAERLEYVAKASAAKKVPN